MAFSGVNLQEVVRNRLGQSVFFLDSIRCTATKAFAEAWFYNPSLLSEVIDWSQPRKEIDIKLFLTSLVGSFQYALLMNNHEIENLVGINSAITWNELIKKFLCQPEIKDSIRENIWRKSTLQFPKRTEGLDKFLSEYFKGKQIWAADLGCGLHIHLPLLSEFSSLNQSASIIKGIGVDIQPRDFEWARANVWPEECYLESVEILKESYESSRDIQEKFPFHQEDLLNLGVIMDACYQGRKLDVILTSFVRHQMEDDFQIQTEVLDVIKDSLESGGLWVDIGEELILETRSYKEWPVRVYKKEQDDLTFLCSPFSLKSTFDAMLWKNQ